MRTYLLSIFTNLEKKESGFAKTLFEFTTQVIVKLTHSIINRGCRCLLSVIFIAHFENDNCTGSLDKSREL